MSTKLIVLLLLFAAITGAVELPDGYRAVYITGYEQPVYVPEECYHWGLSGQQPSAPYGIDWGMLIGGTAGFQGSRSGFIGTFVTAHAWRSTELEVGYRWDVTHGQCLTAEFRLRASLW